MSEELKKELLDKIMDAIKNEYPIQMDFWGLTPSVELELRIITPDEIKKFRYPKQKLIEEIEKELQS